VSSAVSRIRALRPRQRVGRVVLVAKAAGVVCATSVAGAAVFAVGDHDTSATAFLVGAQGAGVVLLGAISWDDARQWATTGVITAAAWALMFLIPSTIYVVDPTLLDVTGAPVEALVLVNLGLFGLIAGVVLSQLVPGLPETGRGPPPAMDDGYSRRWLGLWLGVGLLGLGLVFQGAGGLVEYLSNLDDQGSTNLGRTYFVWMALFTRYAIQILVYRRWASGRSAGLPLSLGLAGAIGLTGLLGARLFVVAALVELALFHAWTRGPASLRKLVPLAVVAAVGLILVGGAVKRYQEPGGPAEPFATYLWKTAPGEVTDAYANNYADGVRLVALALATVPDHAGYEHGEVVLRYLLHPIPRAIRPPEPHRDAALRRAMYPGGGYAYAIPLEAIAYLQGGPIVVLLTFLALGAVVRLVDTSAWRLGEVSFTRVVVLTSLAAAIPSYIRSAEAGGLALAALDVVGLALVAVTVVQRGPIVGRATSERPV
jgi:hypothetical protein